MTDLPYSFAKRCATLRMELLENMCKHPRELWLDGKSAGGNWLLGGAY